MLRVSYSFPHRIGVPGIGTTAWHQVNGLVQLGAQVTLYCGSCERPISGIHKVVETMTLARMKLPYRILGRLRAYQLHDLLVAHFLRRSHPRPDVVHCWPLGSLKTLQVARRLGVPSFLERPNTHTAHAYEVVADEHKHIGLPVPKEYTHAFNAKHLAREEAEYAAADWLLCPSDVVADTFTRRGFDPCTLLRHQYGFDPSLFTSAHRSATREERPFTAVFLGRCEPRKGLHYALKAWHMSGAAHIGRLLICGSFMEGYKNVLEPWLNHPSVEIKGFVPDPHRLLGSADVLLLPAVEEGSALVTYEARGAGCVLLVSSASGAICTPDHDSLVHAPRDVAKLSEHLRIAATQPQRLAELRANSLATASNLTWLKGASRLAECYSANRECASMT